MLKNIIAHNVCVNLADLSTEDVLLNTHLSDAGMFLQSYATEVNMNWTGNLNTVKRYHKDNTQTYGERSRTMGL